MKNSYSVMKLYAKWFLGSLKVNLRSVSFYLLTILMAAGFILNSKVYEQTDKQTLVLICEGGGAQSEDATGSGSQKEALSDYCYDYLNGMGCGEYMFEKISDPDQMLDMIMRSEASCGVVFGAEDADTGSGMGLVTEDADAGSGMGLVTEDAAAGSGIEDALERFSMGVLPDHAVISVYQAPGSVDGYILCELLYPALAKYTSDSYLAGYAGSLLGEEGAGAIVDLYEENMRRSDLKLYETVTTDSISSDKFPERRPRTSDAVRIVLIVFAALLTAVDAFGTDKAFYGRFASRDAVALRIIKILSSIVMSTIFAGIISQIVLY